MRKLWLTGAAILGVTLALGASLMESHAQGYPNRTIRIVVPYAPGGGVSILAQIIVTKMQEIVKQPVVIDNRPGAGGNVGADAVAKAVPDGYTILLHTSAMASAPAPGRLSITTGCLTISCILVPMIWARMLTPPPGA